MTKTWNQYWKKARFVPNAENIKPSDFLAKTDAEASGTTAKNAQQSNSEKSVRI